MIGNGLDDDKIYLVDLGLCVKIDYQIQEDDTFVGTPRFSSTWAHRLDPISYRDDMMSIAYMLAFFCDTRLPWQSLAVTGASSMRIKQIELVKNGIEASDLYSCCKQTDVFRKYFKYCEALPASVKNEPCKLPNYEEPLKMFEEELMSSSSTHFKVDGVMAFDWMRPELPQPPVQQNRTDVLSRHNSALWRIFNIAPNPSKMRIEPMVIINKDLLSILTPATTPSSSMKMDACYVNNNDKNNDNHDFIVVSRTVSREMLQHSLNSVSHNPNHILPHHDCNRLASKNGYKINNKVDERNNGDNIDNTTNSHWPPRCVALNKSTQKFNGNVSDNNDKFKKRKRSKFSAHDISSVPVKMMRNSSHMLNTRICANITVKSANIEQPKEYFLRSHVRTFALH
jgi:hypothetical protein